MVHSLLILAVVHANSVEDALEYEWSPVTKTALTEARLLGFLTFRLEATKVELRDGSPEDASYQESLRRLKLVHKSSRSSSAHRELLEYALGKQAYLEYKWGNVAACRATIKHFIDLGLRRSRISRLEKMLIDDANRILDNADALLSRGNVESAHANALNALRRTNILPVRNRATDILEHDSSINALSLVEMSLVERCFGTTLLSGLNRRVPVALSQRASIGSRGDQFVLAFDEEQLSNRKVRTAQIADHFENEYKSHPLFLKLNEIRVDAIDSTRVRFQFDPAIRRFVEMSLESWLLPNCQAFIREPGIGREIRFQRKFADTNVKTVIFAESEGLTAKRASEILIGSRFDLAFAANLTQDEIALLHRNGWQVHPAGCVQRIVLLNPQSRKLTDEHRRLIQTSLGDFISIDDPARKRLFLESQPRIPHRQFRILVQDGHSNPTGVFDQTPQTANIRYQVRTFQRPSQLMSADYDMCSFEVASDAELLLFLSTFVGAFGGLPKDDERAFVAEWLRSHYSRPSTRWREDLGRVTIQLLRTQSMAVDLGTIELSLLLGPRCRGKLNSRLHVSSRIRER